MSDISKGSTSGDMIAPAKRTLQEEEEVMATDMLWTLNSEVRTGATVT